MTPYIGHFSWDLRRFVASLALMGWQKALPEDAVRALSRAYLQAYVDQVHHYVQEPADEAYALRLDNTQGAIHKVLRKARSRTRTALLDATTEVVDGERRFRRGDSVRELGDDERRTVQKAFAEYLTTLPQAKRSRHDVFYDAKDLVGKKGFGIGSAGLPAYNILIEGFDQALENDIVLTVKQGNIPAPSRVVHDERTLGFFQDEGHRTVVSQRALQVHADPFLGHTTIDGVGFVVAELSPYAEDLDWGDITEPHEMLPVLEWLGRATAKVHCVSDQDSDEDLVTFQTEEAIADALGDDVDAAIEEFVQFGIDYADTARRDHSLFVDAFRSGGFDLVTAT